MTDTPPTSGDDARRAVESETDKLHSQRGLWREVDAIVRRLRELRGEDRFSEIFTSVMRG